MIQSIVRRRPHQDQHIIRSNSKLTQPRTKRSIGLEVGEVNILLRAVIPPHLSHARAVPSQTLRRKTRGHDDTRSETKSEMARLLMLVVHHRDGLHAEQARSQDL